MRMPEEPSSILPRSEQQGDARRGCSRRTFLIAGTAAALAGGGWLLSTRFSRPPAVPVPVDKHRIFNLPQIRDAKTGQHLLTCQSVQLHPGNIFWSPDGRLLVAAQADQNSIGGLPPNAATLQFWDAHSGNALFAYAAPEFPARLLWSPDSRFLAVYTMTSSHCHSPGWGTRPVAVPLPFKYFRSSKCLSQPSGRAASLEGAHKPCAERCNGT
jgi:hypothetical protein